MGCKNSRMHGNPRVSRSILRITPSRFPSIPPSDLDVMRAVIQSTCVTCDLKLRPEVFAFLQHDLPLYHNVTLEDGGDELTVLLLLNKDEKILKSFSLWDKSRDECNFVMEECGFYRRSNYGESVPEQFQSGPYRKRRTSQSE